MSWTLRATLAVSAMRFFSLAELTWRSCRCEKMVRLLCVKGLLCSLEAYFKRPLIRLTALSPGLTVDFFMFPLLTGVPSPDPYIKSHILLHSSSCIYYLQCLPTINPLRSNFEIVSLPTAYIGDNYPLSYSSTSPDGQYILVAGRRGFCIFNTKTNKWKLFGNEIQERRIVLKCVEWYQRFLICLVDDLEANTTEIKVFDSGKNLDLDSIVGEGRVDKKVVRLHICNDLLCLIENYGMILFQIQIKGTRSCPNSLH